MGRLVFATPVVLGLCDWSNERWQNMRGIILICLAAQTAHADPVSQIADAADAAFARMPDVQVVDAISGNCGATDAVDPRVAYCTTRNTVFVSADAYDQPAAPYLVAHAFGHAVQVQHGIADLALREIRNRPEEESMLRGLVERQVDCIAGYLVQRAGVVAPDLTDLFDSDPLTSPHWGRDPLSIGPVVDVNVTDRQTWFAIGAQGNVAACAPGEFTGLGLVRAVRE